VQFFLKSFSFSKNAHGIRKAKLLRLSAVGGAAKLLFLMQKNGMTFYATPFYGNWIFFTQEL